MRNAMVKYLFTIVSAGIVIIPSLCAKKPAPGFPVDIAFVREMSFIPEADTWVRCPDGGFAKDSIAVATAWDTLYPVISSHISPQTLKDLSNWAKDRMADYKTIPPLHHLRFAPYRMDSIYKKIVFQATADSLPTHEQTVTRLLKLFLTYDRIDHRIQRVTITIRGEAGE
jgi:hypothetical protein